MSTPPLPPKRDVALALVERTSIFVHLDPRKDGVVVPPWFRKQPQLVLQVGLNMAVDIPDLRFDEDGLSCTLSFNRSPFFCVMPWTAVFALVGDDGRGMVWPDDVPPEVQRRAVEESKKESDAPGPRAVGSRQGAGKRLGPTLEVAGGPKNKKKREKPRLVALKNEASAEDERRVATLTPIRPILEPSESPPDAKANAPAKDAPAPLPEAAPARPVSPQKSLQKKPKRELPPYLRVVK